ncbi:MAG TPA: hypothetical protein VJJ28_01905 [Candidatus Paceibacterota bacterium]
MKWANFLHIYQPFDQQGDIFEAITAQSYRPLLEKIREHKNVRITLNINGALLELFDKFGYHDLIDILREVGKEGRIEFTSTAKYHAFLPLLEDKEIVRQVKINDETNKFYLGDSYAPKGFFPPEMAYKKEIIPIIESMGFKWIIVDEISAHAEIDTIDYKKIYKIKNSNMKVFFRERRISNLIMSAVVRSPETLLSATIADRASGRYLLTGMDGETFGHHRPGLEKLLFDVFSTNEFELVTVSEIQNFYKDTVEISPVTSTWASSKKDIEDGIQFLSWSDPENKIHTWQWELLRLALKEVYRMDILSPGYKVIREKMDVALASDQFFWASAKPWWSVEMIEGGAYALLEVVRLVPNVKKEILDEASKLYERIIMTAFQWQRSGKIREMFQSQKSILRIPFKDRTYELRGEELAKYNAFIDMMKRLEKEATEHSEYEKAILWRDAVYKIENKLDIYDVMSAVDLLRVEIPNHEVDAMIKKYQDEYRRLRGGQPEQRGS